MTHKLIVRFDQSEHEIVINIMIDKNNEILLKGEIIELDNPEVSYKNYERVF